MKLRAMQDGKYFVGPSGQIRKIVALDWDTGMTTVEVVDRGKVDLQHTSVPDLGARRVVKIASMASWAHREVPDPTQKKESQCA
jgi:hypothetical protein